MKELLKLDTNRVWRTYTGGKLLDVFTGNDNPKDGSLPEIWISSVTEANNPEKIENEGLSMVGSKILRDVISENPAYFLGEKHLKEHGDTLGVLTKLLDSAERLTIQVHPNKEKAMSLFNSKFGKTEAWVIQGGRDVDGDAPHIYFGFKEGITRDKWKEVFDTQNIDEMLGLMHKVYVEPGDIFLIEGGMPHAIGAGCLILEIQEPTDYTIRTEKVTPMGYSIPDRLQHQGLGFDKMFDCFNYDGYKLDELDRWKLGARETSSKNIKDLITYSDTNCFALQEIEVKSPTQIDGIPGFYTLVVMDGAGTISSQNEKVQVQKGDQIFVPGATGDVHCESENGDLKLMRCFPPKS